MGKSAIEMTTHLCSRRCIKHLSLIFLLFSVVSILTPATFAASGITYSGRIVHGDTPLESGTVRFDLWIKSNAGCILYYERRDIDMTSSDGTFSLEIGGTGSIGPAFGHASITSLSDVFDNTKTYANGVLTGTGCAGFTPSADEGRLLSITFTPPGDTAQALPDLALTAVPSALQAFNANKLNSYDHNHVLRIDPTIASPVNSDLNAAKLAEFFRLVNNPTTAYLSSIPTLGGDVSGTLGAMSVDKIKGYAVAAPAGAGDNGKVLTFNSVTGWSLQTPSSSFSSALASAELWVGNSSGGAQARALSGDATISNTGVLTLKNTGTLGTYHKVVTDAQGRVTSGSSLAASDITTALTYTPLSQALTSAQIWVGNASNGAQARAISGDFTLDNTGVATANKTTTGQASKLLSLDASSIGTMSGLALVNTGTVTLSAQTASATYGLKLPAAAPTLGQALKSDASGNLTWFNPLSDVTNSASLADGKMWLGNASGVAAPVTMSGDATISNAGVLTLKDTGTLGTYTKVVTDAQGRVSSGSSLTSSDISAASGWINGTFAAGAHATIGIQDYYNINFKTNGTTAMTIKASGKIGIGNTSPDAAIDLTGPDSYPTTNGEAIRIRGGTAASNDWLMFGVDSTRRLSWIRSIRNGAGSNDFAIQPGGGKVGIGTTAPTGILDINQPAAANVVAQGQMNGTVMWKVVNPGNGITNSWNAANAVEYVGSDTTTGRSINASGTINASGADFAEWVEWTSGVKPEMGSVIKYRGSFVVVSSPHTAAFIGNDVREEKNSILVAFAGQLPVLVRGMVQEGDLIVANDDGTARAVPKEMATTADAYRAVGTAWASSSDMGLKRVHVAVGIGLAGGQRDIASLQAESQIKDQKIKKLEEENAAMKMRLDKIEAMLNAK